MNPLRIPFEEAISEARLLKPWWGELSAQQRVSLKTFYGLPFAEGEVIPGFSERDIWAAQQGFGEYDDLGYLKAVTPAFEYRPQEYREGWGILGVRAGKSAAWAATIVCYEAIGGGHEAYFRQGRQAICFQICQDLRMARYSLHGIRTVLESIPFMATPYRGGARIRNITADRIELWNGMTIATCPPTVRSVRGYDAPVAVMDEIGVWATEADAANQDVEVLRAVASRQAQFEDPKIVGITSPWVKSGVAFERWEAGTRGLRLHCAEHAGYHQGCEACDRLRHPHRATVVIYSPTAAYGNPTIKREFLELEHDRDPKAFDREYLAHFQDSVSGFLDSKRLEGLVDVGVVERAPDARWIYTATMDPGFKRDAFAFAIGHVEPKGCVVDVIRQFKRDPKGEPLNPQTILEQEIQPLLRLYRVGVVECDQYQFEALNQLALNLGFSLNATPFSATSKASIYGNLKALVNQGRIRLVDHPETIRELRQLEIQLSTQGGVSISAPRGQHDDLATVIALLAHHSVWLLPPVPAPVEVEGKAIPIESIHERCLKQAQARFAREDQEAW